MISSRRSIGSAGRITGSKTMVGHSYASLSDVQPLLLVENRHSSNVYVGWYPNCIDVFCLEDEQRRNGPPASTNALNCSYPRLPA